jgi:hypothetical protein
MGKRLVPVVFRDNKMHISLLIQYTNRRLLLIGVLLLQVGHGVFYQLFQHLLIYIRQLFDVKTPLTCFMLSQPVQQRRSLLKPHHIQ